MFRERRGPGIDDGPAPAWARGRHQLTMVRSGKLAGDELGEVNQTVGVAPLVVVPADDIDQVVENIVMARVEDARGWVCCDDLG